jgi:phosphatidylserine synthase
MLGAPVVIVTLLGFAIFSVPRYATGAVTSKLGPTVDAESTYKLLLGVPIYTAWVLALSLAGAMISGLWTGLAALVFLPVIGIVSLWVRERWRWVASDVRRFVVLRSRSLVIDELRTEQERLSRELGDLFDAWEAGLLTSGRTRT